MQTRIAIELMTTTVSARTEWRTVRIDAGDGHYGLGECSDSGPLDEAVDAVAQLAPRTVLLSGLGTLTPADVVQWADETLAALPDSLVVRTVMGGLEQAVCDAAARAAGRGLHAWLADRPDGSDQATDVACYANVNRVPGGRAPTDVARAAAAAVEAGFTTVKCAPFDVPDEHRSLAAIGVERVRAVRDAVGPDITVLVDCHHHLQGAEVFDVADDLRKLDVGWFEDAVAVDDLDGLRELRRHTDLRLAGGELCHDAAQLAPAVAEGLLDVLLLDVKHAAGLTRTRRMARALRAAGDAEITVHNPTGPVATAAGAQLLAALPGAGLLEVAVGEVDWRPTLVRPPETIAGGHLALPDGPGLGVVLDDAAPSSTVWSTTIEARP